MNIDFSKVWVSHQTLRDPNKIEEMVDFAKKGIWDQNTLSKFNIASGRSRRISPLVSINVFPDETMMIHDGHHRSVAAFLAGRELDKDEFKLDFWDYNDYLEINSELSWLTPFDPRTEVRKPDFFQFKYEAALQKPDNLESFIQKNRDTYVESRNIFTLEELSCGFSSSL